MATVMSTMLSNCVKVYTSIDKLCVTDKSATSSFLRTSTVFAKSVRPCMDKVQIPEKESYLQTGFEPGTYHSLGTALTTWPSLELTHSGDYNEL